MRPTSQQRSEYPRTLTRVELRLIQRAMARNAQGKVPFLARLIEKNGRQVAALLLCVQLWGSLAGLFGISSVFLGFGISADGVALGLFACFVIFACLTAWRLVQAKLIGRSIER